MDDFGFILNSNGDGPASRRLHWFPGEPVVTGNEAMDTLNVRVFQLVPTAFYMLTEKLVPDVVEASWLYHLWNLLLHLSTACLAWYAGRQVLQLTGLLKDDVSRSRAALAGAVLFACHPLCSEPVHYAKCLNSITVAMFAMMMCGGAAEWLQTRARRPLWVTIAGLAGATLSYFPGMVLAFAWLVVLLVFWRQTPAAEGERRNLLPPALCGGTWPGRLVCGIAASLTAGFFMWRWSPIFMDQWQKAGSLYPEHLFTQGRLFWSYIGKAVIPLGLCSDHLIPWSRPWLDVEATAKLILAMLTGAVAGVLVISRRAPRFRGWALLVVLATVPLFLRFGYVNAEHFVEYRAYPAVPWLMLLLTTLLFHTAGSFRQATKLPLYATALVAVLFILLSIQRSNLWTDREILARDALAQFPLNPRPLTQLQTIANDSGNPDLVLRLHEDVFALAAKLEAFSRDNPARYYDRVRYEDALVNSCQWKIYAIADQSGSAPALKFADKAIATLRTMIPHRFPADPGNLAEIPWPIRIAREAVANNAAEIDAARASKQSNPAR